MRVDVVDAGGSERDCKSRMSLAQSVHETIAFGLAEKRGRGGK